MVLRGQEAVLTIMPILRCELAGAARGGRLQAERAWFGFLVQAIVLGTFAFWYYWASGSISPGVMVSVAAQSFGWVVALHALLIVGTAVAGALAIAGEKDRQTLGFLLATRLTSAEIILGKLTVRLLFILSMVAAGLPVVLLLDALGGIDLRLILLAYGGVLSTTFFVLSMGIWCSTNAVDGRRANTLAGLLVVAWIGLPMWLGATPIVSRMGIRVPDFILAANSWIIASNPVSLFLRFGIGGVPSGSALLNAVGWMSGLQVAAGVAFLVRAIMRLRPAYRENMDFGGRTLFGRLNVPAFRLRRMRPVGDDPILWKAMEIRPRANVILQVIGIALAAAIWVSLASVTFFFARPAFVELWKHGYHSGAPPALPPELNLVVRFFSGGPPAGAPLDHARVEFNLFLRSITVTIAACLALFTGSAVHTAILTERRRGTWSSLMATPRTGREFLKSFMLSALWQLRWIVGTMLVLWTIGLLAGAIHPLGCLAALVVQAASSWWLLSTGAVAALRAIDRAERDDRGAGASIPPSDGQGLTRTFFLPMGSAALPFLLSGPLSSVLWTAFCPPFLIWAALVSFREMRTSMNEQIYPLFAWIGMRSADSPLAVGAAVLVGICVPAYWGYRNWQYCVDHFDRLVGRPWKSSAAPVALATETAIRLGPRTSEAGLTSA
jgi:hypothetical protein